MPTRPKPKPAAIHPDLESVLFTEAQIKRRVRSIAQELKVTYGDGEFTIVSLINGAIMFTADLMREIDNPVRLDCIRISSYGEKTKSVGTPQVVASLTLDIRNRHVLIIDDILDTGKTMKLVAGLVQSVARSNALPFEQLELDLGAGHPVRQIVLGDRHGSRLSVAAISRRVSSRIPNTPAVM
jgi:pyrimidine operon attenuation protein/uracil phosphoribosyltransferase